MNNHKDLPLFNTKTWMCDVFKNEGELVLYYEHLQKVKYRYQGKWQDQFEKNREMIRMKQLRIDSHQHFWNLEKVGYRWLDPMFGSICRTIEADEL